MIQATDNVAVPASLPDTVPTWVALVAKKHQENIQKTPKGWLLKKDYVDSLHLQPGSKANYVDIDPFKSSGQFSEREVDLTTNYTATELITKVANGEISSLEVTTAFCKRAAVAQQLLSCLTEVFYAEALERARYLDDYLQREGKVVGPLHGFPISIKDAFSIKGQQTTTGWVKYLKNPPSDFNSPVTQMLLDAGAVLYVKTNIPQTQMTGDSENNIFGRTLNPLNTTLTAGGSSGGEGSLVAFRGSILGVGTDIAGSIRIPALCCGVYGFKPSTNRIPLSREGGGGGGLRGLPGHIPSAGPLAHNLDDIEFFMKTILAARPEDYTSEAHAVPWRSNLYPPDKKLRIGILPDEKTYPLHPPVRRALSKAIDALSSAGHEIVPLQWDEDCSITTANLLAFSYYTTIGPSDMGDFFEGPEAEPPVASVAKWSNPMFTGPYPVAPETEPWQKISELHIRKLRSDESWRKRWVENQLDIVLCPGAQNTATPLDTYGWPPYTQIWNVLDYPACIIPYSKASKEQDPEADPNDNFGPQPNYDADACDGMPCAVQVVARRFQDEQCIAAAKIIDAVLKNAA